jgi:hypothetical protein
VHNYEVSEYLMSNVTWHTSAGYQGRNNHKRIYCKDGYNLSVQASATHYCSPREDFGPWYEVEVGYPSAVEDTLMPSSLVSICLSSTVSRIFCILGYCVPVLTPYLPTLHVAYRNVDDDSKPLNISDAATTLVTVYGHVPIDIVEEIVFSHGGIDHAKMEEA